MVKELKKELSKLSGIDFFNPKYRDVFKKYFPNDTTENDVNDNEEDRPKEVLGEENEEIKSPDTQENSTDTVEENADDNDKKEETSGDEQGDETDKVNANTTETNAQDKGEDNAPEAENDDGSEQTETNDEESVDNSITDAPDTTTLLPEQNNTSNELLKMKVELALVRAGVREDRLDAAKKLFMADIHSVEDLSKLKDLVQQYPEWLKQTRQEAQPFGMPLGDNGDGLTEEEKRLKAMGINPRD